jgi:hypothetical protein
MRRTAKRRPSKAICPECGDQMFLVLCGVDRHLKPRTPIEQRQGRCTGHIYIHESTWGIEHEGAWS